MFCDRCGNELRPGDKICGRCGAEVPAAGGPPRSNQAPVRQMPLSSQASVQQKPLSSQTPVRQKPRKGMPRLLVFLLGMLLTAAVAAGLFAGGILQFGQKQQRFEGKGYDSPEEALLDYADALKTGDIDRMISAYAIESYCENFDTQKYIQRMEVYHPFPRNNVVPSDDAVVQRINIENRYSEVTQIIWRQYESLNATYKGEEPLGSAAIVFSDIQKNKEQLKEARRLLRSLQDFPDFQEMETGEETYPVSFWTSYLEIGNGTWKKDLEHYTEYAGAEDYESLAVEIFLDDHAGILTAGCAKYNGKWYLTTNNFVSTVLNMNADCRGATFYPEGISSYREVF